MDYTKFLDRIQHNQPQQGSSSSTNQPLKIAYKKEAAERNITDEEETTLCRFKSVKWAVAKSEAQVDSLLDETGWTTQLILVRCSTTNICDYIEIG